MPYNTTFIETAHRTNRHFVVYFVTTVTRWWALSR